MQRYSSLSLLQLSSLTLATYDPGMPFWTSNVRAAHSTLASLPEEGEYVISPSPLPSQAIPSAPKTPEDKPPSWSSLIERWTPFRTPADQLPAITVSSASSTHSGKSTACTSSSSARRRRAVQVANPRWQHAPALFSLEISIYEPRLRGLYLGIPFFELLVGATFEVLNKGLRLPEHPDLQRLDGSLMLARNARGQLGWIVSALLLPRDQRERRLSTSYYSPSVGSSTHGSRVESLTSVTTYGSGTMSVTSISSYKTRMNQYLGTPGKPFLR
ncbi:hypothetical protein FA95DRAFT_1209157 [Auriscalpium vulgare]|uniref:Uncharacterized protein n=1 Tax=Auriscalpium vulgare TaxID=40419 RepID=A0ACB8RUP8_9AGAM|nr:hypothetical protein FA95DRAFT_1209157 [Auriscalpium vulgare]